MTTNWVQVRSLLVFLFFAASSANAAPPAAPPVPDNPLATLKPEHPRLIVTDPQLAALRQRIERYPRLTKQFEELKQQAERDLEAPVASYDIPDGRRLLAMSRTVVRRVYLLALVHRLEPDPRYRERLWADMQAVAAFPDWNPSHFLDTAEMAHAVAIAYDWLHEEWTDEQRQIMREALLKHAFAPAFERFANDHGGHTWHRAINNWSVVCHSGLSVAALAIGDEEPEAATRILQAAVKYMPNCLSHFAPDGGWIEGPSYWSYTWRYAMASFSAMDTALGTDFGLSDLPGLASSGKWMMHMHSPAGVSFNFADAHATKQRPFPLLWLAQRYDDPACAWYVQQGWNVNPVSLMYDPGELAAPTEEQLPLDAMFRGVECLAMRGSWHDADAIYLAAQCGRNSVGHNHADLGSFILDAGGIRWIEDLGNDQYNLPDYFGSARYSYYRNRTEGHNALLFNPSQEPGQELNGAGKITHFESTPALAEGVMDLTGAYPDAATCTRRLRMIDRQRVELEDTFQLKQPGEAWWFLHTRAQVELAPDGRSATLTRDGKTMRLTLLDAPANAAMQVMAAKPLPTSPDPEGQHPNDGSKLLNAAGNDGIRIGDTATYGEPNPDNAYRKLAIHLAGVKGATIKASFELVE